MPNIATWWLGRADMREQMIGQTRRHGDRASLHRVAGRRMQLGSELLVAKLDEAQRRDLMPSIHDRGIDYVAQEAVTLVDHAGLARRPLAAAAVHAAFVSRQGRRALAGHARRISCVLPSSADARAVSLQRGAATADAWVLSHGPVAETTLLPTPERMSVQRATGALPSRAADNLFWVGRYVERAEATLRLVRALINRVAEADERPRR